MWVLRNRAWAERPVGTSSTPWLLPRPAARRAAARSATAPAPWAARLSFRRPAATERTIRVVSSSATTGTPCPATGAMVSAKSNPTGTVPRTSRRARAPAMSFAATKSSARARFATTATPSTTTAAIPPARFRILATNAFPDNPASWFPCVATSASKRVRSATTVTAIATMAAAALVSSNPAGFARSQAQPASRFHVAVMALSRPRLAKCATTATRRTMTVVQPTARPRVRGVSAHRGSCALAPP